LCYFDAAVTGSGGSIPFVVPPFLVRTSMSQNPSGSRPSQFVFYFYARATLPLLRPTTNTPSSVTCPAVEIEDVVYNFNDAKTHLYSFGLPY